MDLLITLQITADAEDLAWSLQRHLRRAGGPWTVELLDRSETVRVRVPEVPGLQGLVGPVFQWLLPRSGVRSVTLTAPNGEQVVVSADDATQSPPEPVYEPDQEQVFEEDRVDLSSIRTERRRDDPQSVTPPGPVIDPGDDWPQES
ncbi:hypothetical protein G6045_36715 [Streptomyces sp. YC504]|uniref:Uncharacterized protein n=1 Tax=Streptomyces mesophilus TaxID=1775132 RepID=A0A6G4XWI3_9ACTN|nr:hypothetical protein [Streptomyces mesophilus]NGO81167.1 hypothetical protein [Streptomyces mesophilus]